MAKGKRKSGLSGVSRFVFDSMKSTVTQPTDSNAASNEQETVAVDNSTEVIKKNSESVREPPSKKRKGNDGVRIAEDMEGEKEKWIEKYDASGLVPHYTQADQVPQHLQKYFSQRYRFFSLYSTPPGCLLDEEGWYSVTPELVATQIAERCRCDTILDAFCGVGGNAIAFAKTCRRVIALDVSQTRLALARHNAQIYGVADRIEFVLSDYRSFVQSYLSLPSSSGPQNTNSSDRRKIDVVFLSPPWGGPSYLEGSIEGSTNVPATPTSQSTPEHPAYSLSSIQPVHGAELFDMTRKVTKNIAYFLPRNTRLDEISALLLEGEARTGQTGLDGDAQSLPPERIEIEEEWMGNKLKALTCYFGGLVLGQEARF